MLKIQEALDLIIDHYIDELREARCGERRTIPDRYALTILEDTEAIRNYVKPVLADRIRELDEQVPKIRIEDLIGEIEGKEGKISSVWHTGTPTESGEYLVCIRYDFGKEGYTTANYVEPYNPHAGWYNLKPPSVEDGHEWCKKNGIEVIAWQRITPYKEEKEE